MADKEQAKKTGPRQRIQRVLKSEIRSSRGEIKNSKPFQPDFGKAPCVVKRKGLHVILAKCSRGMKYKSGLPFALACVEAYFFLWICCFRTRAVVLGRLVHQ